MVTINGHNFYEVPTSCGTCPFLVTGNTDVPKISSSYSRGHCLQWDESHHTWANIPRRCKKIFKSAFEKYNDCGQDLVIINRD